MPRTEPPCFRSIGTAPFDRAGVVLSLIRFLSLAVIEKMGETDRKHLQSNEQLHDTIGETEWSRPPHVGARRGRHSNRSTLFVNDRTYYAHRGSFPDQTQKLTGQAIFKTAYAFIPKGVMTDGVTSALPFWTGTRAWIISRPMTGFAETFSQYIMEVMPGGGSDRPETEDGVEHAFFVTAGDMVLTVDGSDHHLTSGGFAYIPCTAQWSLRNRGDEALCFHWIRKAYEWVDGIDAPDFFTASDRDKEPSVVAPGHEAWLTTRLIDPDDIRHDMNVNIVTFLPGGVIPFEETHVMEHGLYVLEGGGVYELNQDWVEVEAGDYMWLRAFCPQSCYARGPGRFRYLLYKNVNRHMPMMF